MPKNDSSSRRTRKSNAPVTDAEIRRHLEAISTHVGRIRELIAIHPAQSETRRHSEHQALALIGKAIRVIYKRRGGKLPD